jgi:hypothetical protein
VARSRSRPPAESGPRARSSAPLLRPWPARPAPFHSTKKGRRTGRAPQVPRKCPVPRRRGATTDSAVALHVPYACACAMGLSSEGEHFCYRVLLHTHARVRCSSGLEQPPMDTMQDGPSIREIAVRAACQHLAEARSRASPVRRIRAFLRLTWAKHLLPSRDRRPRVLHSARLGR